ncbi:MAG: acylphosphatase [Thalassospira sp.]|nr:acylphosphatase [Thalassospira sp.]MDP2698476.1 acylphosphatase [Thalassospira sp.]
MAVHVRIEGKVQGVWFRAWTVEQAQKHGLGGWVRNRSDGSVEAVFCGPVDCVQSMITACHDGPPLAKVLRVHQESTADDGAFAGFEKRPTV